MLRYLTAGESHGRALVATIEGIPAHVRITTAEIAEALARRRLGTGRGARMKFEADEVTLLTGVRHGETLGSPIAIMIGNSEWPKWETVMSADPVDAAELAELARNAALTRPRPGHADLAGMQKYDWDEARPILERASARETAARVALGRVAANFLEQAFGIRILSHVVRIGGGGQRPARTLPTPDDLAAIDAHPVRCFDPRPARRCWPRSPRPRPTATPSAAWSRCWPTDFRRASARTARVTAVWMPGSRGALMGIQAIKGVEVGRRVRPGCAPAAASPTTRWCPPTTACGGCPTAPAAPRAA